MHAVVVLDVLHSVHEGRVFQDPDYKPSDTDLAAAEKALGDVHKQMEGDSEARASAAKANVNRMTRQQRDEGPTNGQVDHIVVARVSEALEILEESLDGKLTSKIDGLGTKFEAAVAELDTRVSALGLGVGEVKSKQDAELAELLAMKNEVKSKQDAELAELITMKNDARNHASKQVANRSYFCGLTMMPTIYIFVD